MVRNFRQGITLITPTSDRPEALQRAAYYVFRQSFHWHQWIIVDDGTKSSYRTETFSDDRIHYVKREPAKDKARSLTGNLIAACGRVIYNKVFIIEDDDWYHPDYLKQGCKVLDHVGIGGEKFAVYYNVRHRKFRIQGNDDRASLCQTYFTANFLTKLAKYCKVNKGSAFVDARLWNHVRKNNIPHRLLKTRLCIGIKGMPGKKGIGIGHRPGRSFKHDKDWKMLKRFIGEQDAQWYIDLIKKK